MGLLGIEVSGGLGTQVGGRKCRYYAYERRRPRLGIRDMNSGRVPEMYLERGNHLPLVPTLWRSS